MSFLVNLLCRGSNQPSSRGFAAWLGRWLALRNRNVCIAPDAAISPGALINPRNGGIEIGARSLVAAGAIIAGNVKIGQDSSVQNYTVIVGYGTQENPVGQIRIGNGVRIAAHCMIVGGNHRFDDPEKPIREQGIEPKPIVIEDDVWIGGRVNIMAGVTIGHGCVIGAGSVVTRDIPPMSIAVGVPARPVSRRNSEKNEQNKHL
ncbi:MAG: acetyltransferase [Lentisphaeria bacterium]|nr:acetyltransferase [Lentisphaeria bacterium]